MRTNSITLTPMIIKAISAIIVCTCAFVEIVLVGLIIYDHRKRK